MKRWTSISPVILLLAVVTAPSAVTPSAAVPSAAVPSAGGATTPSPLKGEGWGEGDSPGREASTEEQSKSEQQSTPSASRPVERAGAIRIVTLDWTADAASDIRWTAAGLQCRAADGETRRASTADVVSVARSRLADEERAKAPDSAQPPTPSRWEFLSADDERLRGAAVTGDSETVRVRLADGRTIQLALDRLRTIRPLPGDAWHPGDATATRDGNTTEDVIDLRNGDRAAGLIERIDAAGVHLDAGGDSKAAATATRTLPWDVIAAVRLAGEPDDPADAEQGHGAAGVGRDAAPDSGASNLPDSAPNTAPRVLLTTSAGDVLAAESLEWRDGRIVAHRPGGQTVELRESDLQSASVRGGRWTWLSDLPAAAYESIPFTDLTWPLMRDASASGGPLACAGHTAEKGLGLHAACRVAWNLNGRFQRFSALIGIDDSGGRWSDATVEIKLDGATATRFEHLRHAQPPRPIELDVSSTKRLEIVVSFGANGDVQDRVDLLDAALIRKR